MSTVPMTDDQLTEELQAIERKEAYCRIQLDEVQLSISAACRRARRTGRYEDHDEFDDLQERQLKLKRELGALDTARQNVGRRRKQLRVRGSQTDENHFIKAAKEVLPDALYAAVWERASVLMQIARGE